MAFSYDGTFLFFELPPETNLIVENAIYPAVFAIAFIFAGYKIAPKYKFKTAIVLFGIYSIAWLTMIAIVFFQPDIYGENLSFPWRAALSLVGAIIGLYVTKRYGIKKIEENPAEDKELDEMVEDFNREAEAEGKLAPPQDEETTQVIFQPGKSKDRGLDEVIADFNKDMKKLGVKVVPPKDDGEIQVVFRQNFKNK